MKLLNHTIIRICLILIFGILTGFYFKISPLIAFIFLASGLLLFLLAFLKSGTSLFPEVYFGLSAYLTIFAVGMTCVTINKPENQARHYINVSTEDLPGSPPLASLRIKEKLKPGKFNERFIAEVEQLVFKNPETGKYSRAEVHGKILLNIQRDTSAPDLYAGNRILAAFSPSDIQSPLNPHQFDYRGYMSNLGVKRQLQLASAQFQVSELSKSSPVAGLRENVITSLSKQNFSKEEMAIIQALLLGQRQEISKELYEDYAAAGAIHILAVSGLHVGILLLILNFLLSPFDRNRQTKLIKTILLIFLLWGFAALAGFSASVVRAVTMFSFIAIGMQLNRRTSLMNILFTSLFILLLVNPYYIFQAGFQLSYLAVFSIIVLYKPLSRIYSPIFKSDRYIRDLLAVSISAQLGVLPLSLFYFHQFPGLFFVTNLVILPFLGLIISFGILVILLAVTGILPHLLVVLFGGLISSMNAFIALVADQEEFLFSEIHFSKFNLISAYLLLLLFLTWLYRKTYSHLIFLLMGIIVFQVSLISGKGQNTSEAVIFHKSGDSIIAIKEKRGLSVYRSKQDSAAKDNPVTAYKQFHNIRIKNSLPLRNFYAFKGKELMIIDTTAPYQKMQTTPDFILLRNSPKVNLERLLLEIRPEMIIADGSNYNSYINRWKATCIKEKVPFHHTGEKGAFHILAGP